MKEKTDSCLGQKSSSSGMLRSTQSISKPARTKSAPSPLSEMLAWILHTYSCITPSIFLLACRNIPHCGTNSAAVIGDSAFLYSTQKPQFPECGTWSCHHKQQPATQSSAGNFPLMQRRRGWQLWALLLVVVTDICRE